MSVERAVDGVFGHDRYGITVELLFITLEIGKVGAEVQLVGAERRGYVAFEAGEYYLATVAPLLHIGVSR